MVWAYDCNPFCIFVAHRRCTAGTGLQFINEQLLWPRRLVAYEAQQLRDVIALGLPPVAGIDQIQATASNDIQAQDLGPAARSRPSQCYPCLLDCR